MAISVDWITGEISVPKADTVLVSAGPPEVRSFDLDQFRQDLRTAEAGVEGVPWTRTHNHNAEVLLSGFTYARSVEIIAPYFVTFEDGQYVVNLEGANHNILDVGTANQVSLRAQNSGGLLVAGTALSVAEQAKLDELWKLQGLDIANLMTVTPTLRDAGAGLSQTISGDGTTTSTVTRDP